MKISFRGKVFLLGQMGENIRGSGSQGNSMGSGFIQEIKILLRRKEKGNGWKENELNG